MSTKENIAIAEVAGIPEGWEWSTLGDVSEKPQYGWTTKANHDTGKLKLLRTTDITSGSVDWSSVPFCTEEPEDIEKYLIESGDVLISRAGSVGVSFLINKPERAVFASYLIRFRPKKGIDTKYFYYYLKSPSYWNAIGARKSGIAVPNVNASKLAQVPIPIAPVEQQKHIVSEVEKQFSRLDAAVANLKRVKTNLKRYKAAVLKAAVEGRLVETEAEIARREGRSYETGAQLLQRILETRRSQWKGKGKYKEPAAPDTTELPEGWVWATVNCLGKVIGGLTKNPKRTRLTKKLPYLRVANVYANELRLEDVEEIGIEERELEKLLVIKGDLLIVEGNGSPEQIGRLAVWDGSIEQCVHQNHLIKVRLPPECLPQWMLSWLMSPAGRNCIKEVASSTSGLYTLSVGKIGGLPVPLPPVVEQERIISEIDRRLSICNKADAQVDANLWRAERLRQAALGSAFSGELFFV